jgi:hypothetical protein
LVFSSPSLLASWLDVSSRLMPSHFSSQWSHPSSGSTQQQPSNIFQWFLPFTESTIRTCSQQYISFQEHWRVHERRDKGATILSTPQKAIFHPFVPRWYWILMDLICSSWLHWGSLSYHQWHCVG